MKKKISSILKDAVKNVQDNHEGEVASYIPELAASPVDYTSIALTLIDGKQHSAGDDANVLFTLQSAAKLVILIAMLEEFGEDKVFSLVRVEPSGADFNSVARLDQFGPKPSNPMLNSGAILLCCHVPGETEERFAWLDAWMEKLFMAKLSINSKVFASERRTGDRNRALAYLLKSNGLIQGGINDLLETYFYLCSFEASPLQASYLPMLLANQGYCPNRDEQIISQRTARIVTAIMATCGMYNESGRHLVRTGMPSKSSVSGYILSVAPGHGGFAAMSPRVNPKGTSIRSEIMLQSVAEKLDWYLNF